MVQINFGGLTFGKNPVVKSVQYSLLHIEDANTSDTNTINSVDTSNSMLLHLGCSVKDDASKKWMDITARIELTNSTTVTAARYGSHSDIWVRVCIIEFYPGVVKSSQTGNIALSGTSGTDSINSVNTNKSMLLYLGHTTNSIGTTLDSAQSELPRITLTNATTITATRYESVEYIVTVYHQVVEFY